VNRLLSFSNKIINNLIGDLFMFSKKTLSAAVAVALSLGISTSAQATDIALSAIDFHLCRSGILANQAGCAPNNVSLKYAYEQFGSGDVSLGYTFRARYRPTSSNLGKGYDFYVTFTLDGGATWGKNLSASNLIIQDESGATTLSVPQISIVAKGSSNDNSVSYRVNTSKTGALSTANILDFTFTVGKAQNALKTAGGQITLSSVFKVAQTTDPIVGNKDADTSSKSLAIATSVSGADLAFSFDQGGAKAYIDVANDGKSFTGSGIKPLEVDYGYLRISSPGEDVLNRNATTPQFGVFDGIAAGSADLWTPKLKTFKLTIENGNFNASGAPSEGKVYIKLDTSGSKILKATTFSADKLSATWDISSSTVASNVINDTTTTITQLLTETLVDGINHQIMLSVNGTDAIAENRKVEPKGTLRVEYDDGNGGVSAPVTQTATLRHLKRNGTVCTLYNIPVLDALDVLNIRLINDSPNVAGFVKGTLRYTDEKGNVVEVFKSKTLVEAEGLQPHQSIRIGVDELQSNGEAWTGRGVLTLESNIPEPYLQVYALLRAKMAGVTGDDVFPESPLMNMSTGASGNGCD
jgi:hypothetical protein